MTLQDVSNHLGVSWDMVKEVHDTYLERHYSPTSLEGVENIGIDEFAVRKGHVYKTIVVDLDSDRVMHVGESKGTDALSGFWRKVRRKGERIRHVATDLSAALIVSVLENCPRGTDEPEASQGFQHSFIPTNVLSHSFRLCHGEQSLTREVASEPSPRSSL